MQTVEHEITDILIPDEAEEIDKNPEPSNMGKHRFSKPSSKLKTQLLISN